MELAPGGFRFQSLSLAPWETVRVTAMVVGVNVLDRHTDCYECCRAIGFSAQRGPTFHCEVSSVEARTESC